MSENCYDKFFVKNRSFLKDARMSASGNMDVAMHESETCMCIRSASFASGASAKLVFHIGMDADVK